MNKENNPDNKVKRILNHPIIKIILGIITCLVIPVLTKAAILNPLFSLFDLSENTTKSIQAIFSIAIILTTYSLFFKFYEKRKIAELSRDRLMSDSIVGLLSGFTLISLVTAFLYFPGYYKILSVGNLSTVIKALIFFSLMGIFEEIVFRGVIYRITEKWLGTVWALIISSFVFGFFHVSNTNFNLFSGFAIALEGGLLTGIFYTFTQRLWFPIALHVGWNLSFVFWGTTVSGATELPNFITAVCEGPELLTGGNFGPENSVITVLLSLILFIIVYLKASKKGLIIEKSRGEKN